MARRVPSFCDEVFGGIERFRVVADLCIGRVERPPGEQFKEEPCAPARGSGGLTLKPDLQYGRVDRLHRGGDHTEVERFVPEREPQMSDHRASRRVGPGVEFDDVRAVDFRPPCAGDNVALAASRWDAQSQLAPEP